MGDGNQAYVDDDVLKAIETMQEVLRIEPRATQAWVVLAKCYEDLKQPEKSLQLSVMAAHLQHDADEWERLARQSRYDLSESQYPRSDTSKGHWLSSTSTLLLQKGLQSRSRQR